MAATTILDILDGLNEHLADSIVTTKYPELAKMSLNTFDDPDVSQSPSIDLHPLNISVQPPATPGNKPEHAVATIGVSITVSSTQYITGARDAFSIWNDLRRALNMNSAALRAGVSWIWLTRGTQVQPDFDDAQAFIFIEATIVCGFEIDAL